MSSSSSSDSDSSKSDREEVRRKVDSDHSEQDEVASNASEHGRKVTSSPSEQNEAAEEVASNRSERADDDEASSRSEKEDGEEVARELILSDSDEEAPPEPEIIVDEIPSNRLELGDLGPVFVRLPNFLSIEPKPFDPRTYQAELDDDEIVDVEGRSRMKLKIENTIRWRNVRDPETGEIRKESNAKIIKWSDGTMSLHLGNEIFEIQDQKAMPNLHLFTRQGASLQAQSSFERKFAFRPHSTDTLTHRKMTMNMADKSNRAQKVKLVTDVGINPEKSRSENIKREDKQIRDLNRKQAIQRRARERIRETGLSSGFLEGYDDSDEENVGALKRSYGNSGPSRGSTRPYDRDYDSESDEEESRKAKSLRDAKQRIESSDEEMQDEGQDSQSASGSQPRKAQPAAGRRIIEDDDE